MKSNADMIYIIPPSYEPTVPLLGPYQIAGYAKKIGYIMKIFNFNNFFLQEIINNCKSDVKAIISSRLDKVEVDSYKKFLEMFENIKDYDDFKRELRDCSTTERYWLLVDYIRCSYDLYSMQYKNLRFRLDGVDSHYKWNVWKDLDCFTNEFYRSAISNSMKKWISDINISQNSVIGMNITFESQLFFAIICCKLLNELYPNNKIIVGGVFVNSFINSADSIGPLARYCDLVNSGEGEALIWYLYNKKNNLCDLLLKAEKSESKAYYISAEKICDQKISICPPFITRAELDNYLSPLRIVPLRFTYQCYWGKCKFCTDQEFHSCLDNKYNLDELIDFCIQNSKNGNIEGIYFLDSAIPLSTMKKFCRALIDNDIRIKWGTNARFEVGFTNEEFVRLLSKAGCVFIKFGLESGSQRMLDLMAKGIRVNNASSIIQLCRKFGILVHTYIMFAYPGETDDDRDETIKFILDERSHPDNYSCSEFVMYANSRVAKEMNYLLPKNLLGDGWTYSSDSFTSQHIKDQIQELRGAFDEKYSPADVLLSTGHTISLANSLKRTNRKIKLYKNSELRIQKTVVIDKKNRIVSKWRRKNGIVYLENEYADVIISLEGRVITAIGLLELGLNTNTIYELVNEGFFELHNNNPNYALPYEGNNLFVFNYGNRFNSLTWYGYYDNN